MLKGLNDFINEDKVPYDFGEFVEMFKKAGYDLNKIVKELKDEYRVTLKPCKITGRYNESETALEMCVNNTPFHKVTNSHNVKQILSDIVEGLAHVPVQSYLNSQEYRKQQLLNDAKARASGFKDQADLTKAYYEK